MQVEIQFWAYPLVGDLGWYINSTFRSGEVPETYLEQADDLFNCAYDGLVTFILLLLASLGF